MAAVRVNVQIKPEVQETFSAIQGNLREVTRLLGENVSLLRRSLELADLPEVVEHGLDRVETVPA